MQKVGRTTGAGDPRQGESIQESDGEDSGELGVAKGTDLVYESESDGPDNAYSIG